MAPLGAAALLGLAACGGGGDSTTKVATLGTDAVQTQTSDSVPADAQEQWLAFAQCMRDNGVDMQDPTFDADGNVQGGGFGPDSGIDMRDDASRTAMTACQDQMPAGGPGGGNRPDFDTSAIQDGFNSFTECLRDEGLEVDDIDFTFGPGGGGGNGGPPASGDIPTPGSGDVPGGFGGGAPPDGGGGGPQGDFDPTSRIIEQLGLDTDDPAVTAAVDACSSVLEGVFQGPGGGATTTTEAGS